METLRRMSSLFVKQPLFWDFVIEALSSKSESFCDVFTSNITTRVRLLQCTYNHQVALHAQIVTFLANN